MLLLIEVSVSLPFSLPFSLESQGFAVIELREKTGLSTLPLSTAPALILLPGMTHAIKHISKLNTFLSP